MPTLRQRVVSSVLRTYPFYSGCGRIANHPFVASLAGTSNEETWARVPGGEVLAPLDDLMGRAAYYAGEHDRKITWICRKLIRRGDTVLDIGANLGMVTVHMASLVGRSGMVHAFEPNPRLVGLLSRAIDRNCLPQVKLHEFGLGPEESTLELRIPQSNTGEGSFVHNRDMEDCLSVQSASAPWTMSPRSRTSGASRCSRLTWKGSRRQSFAAHSGSWTKYGQGQSCSR